MLKHPPLLCLRRKTHGARTQRSMKMFLDAAGIPGELAQQLPWCTTHFCLRTERDPSVLAAWKRSSLVVWRWIIAHGVRSKCARSVRTQQFFIAWICLLIMTEIHVFLRVNCDSSVPQTQHFCMHESVGQREIAAVVLQEHVSVTLCAWREIHVLAVRDRSCFLVAWYLFAHAENSKCEGRWFPVSSCTQVETQATHLATAKDARSTNAAVHEYFFGRGGDSGWACAAASLMRDLT